MNRKLIFNAKKRVTQRRRQGLDPRPNGRSTDFVMAGFATGCKLACSYCYVARHRPFGNPIEIYTNPQEIWEATYLHYLTLPEKIPNQCDPKYWTYDIGESTDCLLPDNITRTNYFIRQFLSNTEAKPSFATKICQLSKLKDCPIPRRARIRFSLMPQKVSSLVEVGTSKISKRIQAINEAYAKGYEVHINFSPVILYKNWENDYIDLFAEIKETLQPEVLSQIKSEVIFLTHSYPLSTKNDKWNPEAERILKVPSLQEPKTTQRGDSSVVRYRSLSIKANAVIKFRAISKKHLPMCQIRYIF